MKMMLDPSFKLICRSYFQMDAVTLSIKASYLKVTCAEYTFPSFNLTVINLQVPAHDFDVCQL